MHKLNFLMVVLLVYWSSAMKDCPSKCSCKILKNRSKYGVSVDCSSCEYLSIPAIIPENTTVVNLHGNKLRQIKNISFKYWTASLLFLDLSYCEIDNMETRALEPLPNLERLELNGNKLQTIRHVILPISLKILNVAVNPLRQHSNENLINDGHELSKLDISKTNLTESVLETIKSIKIVLITCDEKEEEEFIKKYVNIKCITSESSSESSIFRAERPNNDVSSSEITISTTERPVKTTSLYPNTAEHSKTSQPSIYQKVTEQTSDEFTLSEEPKHINIVSVMSYSSFALGLFIGFTTGAVLGYIISLR